MLRYEVGRVIRVVVAQFEHVLAIGLENALRTGRAPIVSAVQPPMEHHPALRDRPCQADGGTDCIRPGPQEGDHFGRRDHVDKTLRKLSMPAIEQRRMAAEPGRLPHCVGDGGVAVSQYDRAVAQRAIDVAMAVDVPEIGCLRIAKRTAARPRSGHSRPRACGPTPAPGRRSRDRDGAGFSPLSDPARRTPCRPGRSDRDNARRRQYPPEATRTPDDPGRFRL